MAAQAAIAAFRDPGGVPGGENNDRRRQMIDLYWACYRNTNFDDLAAWLSYRQTYQLYRNIRSIYNPTKRLVNFYVSQVYPGVLSEDASKLPDGVGLAIPFPDDTDEKLKAAIAQFWQWSNWQSNNRLMVRYGAATGSCLVEVDDNVARGKVSAIVQWPGRLASAAKDDSPSLVLDDSGNVKFYALEYQALDEKGETFTYRKEVSQESIVEYRDETKTSENKNPYGFVSAVWCKHIDEGDDYGAPAIAGSLTKIDELNGLVSHTHDQVDILIDSPGIIASSGNVGLISETSANLKATAADEYSAVGALKEKPTKRLLLHGPADSSWVPLTGNLEPDKIVPLIDRALTEIEHDFPELSMYQELRKMSQVTGPAAARMMGDVGSRVLEVQSNYDTQSIKLFQMAVAIGGFRYREGKEGWRDKNDQRNKFAPFNLESYQKGDLNLSIMPRPLIPVTEDDTITITGKRLDNAKKAQGIFSDDKILEVAGISDEDERTEMLTQRQAEAEKAANANQVAMAGQAARGAPAGVRNLFAAK